MHVSQSCCCVCNVFVDSKPLWMLVLGMVLLYCCLCALKRHLEALVLVEIRQLVELGIAMQLIISCESNSSASPKCLCGFKV